MASACPLPPSAVIATIEGTADQIPALSSIATNGRRLNVGSAVASCADAGHTAGTGTAQVHVYQNPYYPDTGSVNVTIAGITTSYSYDTSVDTTDSVGQGLADYLNGGPYVRATYQGNGLISLITTAKGPYTVITNVSNDCDPASECGKPPTISHTGMTAGN